MGRTRNQAGLLVLHAAIVKMRRAMPAVVALALLFAGTSYGQESRLLEGLTVQASAPALALSRYLASVQDRNPFTEAGPTRVQIDASLPSLGKQGSLSAIREAGASERSEYRITEFKGDPTVKREVIARYLNAQEQAEALPYSSVAVTPANYKFRYLGSVRAGGPTAYVFQILPRQKRVGLVRGQIWIDSESGLIVRQTGRFVKQPSVFIRRIEVVRDTQRRAGTPWTRVTHIAIETRLVGRADLTITERPMNAENVEIAQ